MAPASPHAPPLCLYTLGRPHTCARHWRPRPAAPPPLPLPAPPQARACSQSAPTCDGAAPRSSWRSWLRCRTSCLTQRRCSCARGACSSIAPAGERDCQQGRALGAGRRQVWPSSSMARVGTRLHVSGWFSSRWPLGGSVRLGALVCHSRPCPHAPPSLRHSFPPARTPRPTRAPSAQHRGRGGLGTRRGVPPAPRRRPVPAGAGPARPAAAWDGHSQRRTGDAAAPPRRGRRICAQAAAPRRGLSAGCGAARCSRPV
jgi:hypothetical protein